MMWFSFVFLGIFLFIVSIQLIGADDDCPHNYNYGQTSFQCGPGNPPCVILQDDAVKLTNSSNLPLICDEEHKICQYSEYSALTVECPQGEIDIYWSGDNNTFISNANNSFVYYTSNTCAPNQHSRHSSQNGDTLTVDCNPMKDDPFPCNPDYNYLRMATVEPDFQCGPGLADCVVLEGGEGVLIESPTKADQCDPTITFCSFPYQSEFAVQCKQGIVTVQFNGSRNTFQNQAQNSLVFWMSNSCTNPNNNTSTQDGDLLVVYCNPFFVYDI